MTTYVIDPSQLGKVVLVDAWKAAQGNADAVIVETGPEPYYRAPDGTVQKDPDYTSTNQALASFRLALKNRSVQQGPPPYAHCPVAPSS